MFKSAKLFVPALAILCSLLLIPSPSHAQNQILYTSAPDRLGVFLNDIAFVEDVVTVPGGVDIRVALPQEAFPDTLILTENDQRVPNYRINNRTGQLIVEWQSADADVVEVRLQYLMRGISWQPTYDMMLMDEETVQLDFYAEIANRSLFLDEVAVQLIAGRVDLSEAVDTVTTITYNQVLFEYSSFEQNNRSLDVGPPTTMGSGAASIQHVYDARTLSAQPGDILYNQVLSQQMPARRGLVWNATGSNEVDVIYKVTNASEQPLAQGIVRNYQDGLFLGSDFIELTPIGGEGSVTVGNFQQARVLREAFDEYIGGNSNARDNRTTINLSITNFSAETISVEIADGYPANANTFTFNIEGERGGDNRLRWTLDIEPGASITIEYSYLS